MNKRLIITRRWLAIAWLACGVFIFTNSFAWSKPDGQTTLAPGYLILVDDKLYVADFMYRGIVQALHIDCHGTRIVLNANDPGNRRNATGFAVDANGQLTLTKDVKSEIKLNRKILEDTRNPKLDAIDLRASSWRYLYALEADRTDPRTNEVPTVVIAEETIEISLTPGQKITARPVLLRVRHKGDAYLKFEVNYTSGK